MRMCGFAVLLLLVGVAGCKHRSDAGSGARETSGASAGESPASAEVRVAKVQHDLLTVQSTPMETDVPAAAQGGIVQLKNALVTLTDGELATLPANVTDRRVSEVLNALLPPPLPKQDAAQSAKAPEKEDFKPEAGDYGDELAATVSTPTPGILLVQEHFDVMCGQDTLLLAYSNASGSWKRVLRWQAPAYKQVSGAFGDWYETRLLTPQRNGHPVLLVLHGTPWCTSTISSFSVDTLELNPDVETETAFFHASHDYRRADDDPPASLKITPDGFEVRASVDSWDDRIARKGVMRYRMNGNTVVRTLPIAMDARDTVDEWMSLPRSEAELFTDAPPGSAVWAMFDTFTYEGKGDSANTPSRNWGEVRACTDDPRHYQVELDSEVYSANNKTHRAGPSYFVQVIEAGNGYRIHQVLSSADSACGGRLVMRAAD